MNRSSFVLLVLLSVAFSFTACQSREVKETKEVKIIKEIDADAEPGLIHNVYFWMNDDVDEAATKAFEEGIWSLEEIPSVKRMFVGPAAPTPSREVVDNSFDFALIVWFDDVAGHEIYQDHPIHLKFVEEHGDKFKKVRVRDNLLQESK